MKAALLANSSVVLIKAVVYFLRQSIIITFKTLDNFLLGAGSCQWLEKFKYNRVMQEMFKEINKKKPLSTLLCFIVKVKTLQIFTLKI